MSEQNPVDPRETLYPESPTGEPYEIAPKPFSDDLKRRLDEIGEQDVGAPR